MAGARGVGTLSLLFLSAAGISACMSSSLGAPSASNGSTFGAAPAISASPELPADLAALASRTQFVTFDPRPETGSPWFVGTLGGERVDLPLKLSEGTVRVDSGRVVASQSDGSAWTISEFDAAGGKLVPIYRTADGVTSNVQGTISAAGSTLVVAGIDLGIRTVDLGSGEAAQLVPPMAIDQEGGPADLGNIEWSPSGATLAVAFCRVQTCVTSVISGDGKVTTIPDFVLQGATDTSLLGYASLDDRRWLVMDLSTGMRRVVADSFVHVAYDGYPISDTEFLVYGEAAKGPGYSYVVVAAASDTERLVHAEVGDLRVLYELWRSTDWALLGGPDGMPGAIARGDAWDVLGLNTGILLEGAVQVSR